MKAIDIRFFIDGNFFLALWDCKKKYLYCDRWWVILLYSFL